MARAARHTRLFSRLAAWLDGSPRSAIVAGALAALLPAILYAGFTVDDALIPARYAHHIALGQGYVFNSGGPSTDGVTPLGFPYLLAPFAKPGPLAALAFARALGALSWIAGSGLVALVVQRIGGSPLRYTALLIVACSAPLAAWCQAGLETGLAAALVGTALALRSLGYVEAAAATVGVSAALRPELLPMALVVAFPSGASSPRGETATISVRHFARLGLGAALFVAVAIVRSYVFGRAAPLSLYAKPPDTLLGAKYALACFILTGPIAVLAPLAMAKVNREGRWLVAAVFVHYCAVVAVGGDWMPLSRLVVPAMPVVVVAAAYVAAASDRLVAVGRLLVAISAESITFIRMHEASVRVLDDRTALIEEVSPWLADRKAIATVDIGWVGAATNATVVDLAGVTDPFVAFLPGTHTSKVIPDAMIDARGVDTLVLLLHQGGKLGDDWQSAPYDRGVERYVALGPGMRDEFYVAHVSSGRLHYVVLYRLEEKLAGLRPTPRAWDHLGG